MAEKWPETGRREVGDWSKSGERKVSLSRKPKQDTVSQSSHESFTFDMWGRLGDNASRRRDGGQEACVAPKERAATSLTRLLLLSKALVKSLDRS